MHYIIFTLFLLFFNTFAEAQTLSLSPQTVDSLDTYVKGAIEDHYFPGAQLVVGNSDGVVYSQSYGYLDYSNKVPVDSATLYDLASCTKVLATTLAIMTLVDQRQLSLKSKVGKFLEGGDTLAYANVRIRNLLYHNSGFRAGVGVARSLVNSADESIPLMVNKRSDTNPYIYDNDYFVARDIIYDTTYVTPHGRGVQITNGAYLTLDYHTKLDSMVCAAYDPKQEGVYAYSDLNFYILGKVIKYVTDLSLSEYVDSIYRRMSIRNLGFNPLSWHDIENIAPTEYDPLLRRDTVRGVVHDELAFVQDGVCGGAGLFGSAEGIAPICGMFLRGGVDYYGNDIVNTSTVSQFARAKRFKGGGIHGLGFDKVDPTKMPYPIESYGHAGFTGTYFWVDPTQNLYVILLTNRIHPTRVNRKLNGEYRAKLWEIICRDY